jgi:hypothetical protein
VVAVVGVVSVSPSQQLGQAGSLTSDKVPITIPRQFICAVCRDREADFVEMDAYIAPSLHCMHCHLYRRNLHFLGCLLQLSVFADEVLPRVFLCVYFIILHLVR